MAWEKRRPGWKGLVQLLSVLGWRRDLLSWISGGSGCGCELWLAGRMVAHPGSLAMGVALGKVGLDEGLLLRPLPWLLHGLERSMRLGPQR